MSEPLTVGTHVRYTGPDADHGVYVIANPVACNRGVPDQDGDYRLVPVSEADDLTTSQTNYTYASATELEPLSTTTNGLPAVGDLPFSYVLDVVAMYEARIGR